MHFHNTQQTLKAYPLCQRRNSNPLSEKEKIMSHLISKLATWVSIWHMMNYAFTLQCTSIQAIWGLFRIKHCSWHRHWHRNVWFCPFFLCPRKRNCSSCLNHEGPRFNSAYSISNPLSSIIIHVAAALILAISLGAIFCPSNVYRENVSLFQLSILRSHNGISTVRRGCTAIHAKHVCLLPSRYTTKGLISSIRKVLNSSTLHYGIQWHSSRMWLGHEGCCAHYTQSRGSTLNMKIE